MLTNSAVSLLFLSALETSWKQGGSEALILTSAAEELYSLSF